ncbi:transcriptional regulator [Streptomyces sp. CB00455]|uniref:MarR family winged helix-turn-helix transcriptional regulator n=1 Tax=Streptomyces sp. CB00455 TaxID=1703927 RepID=UPI00093C15AE|nr:MarR family transcriptional regulator [Streptomyces sp. CB00455]OKK21812.1 transcriptional regulator [Streptomyces sp. CB00455]
MADARQDGHRAGQGSGGEQDARRAVFREYIDAVGLHGTAGAEAAGLQASEWYALSRITLAGGLTPGELATATGLTSGATTRLIDRLERAGYVRRTADPTDRRKVIVDAVPGALSAVEGLVGPARRRIADVLTQYTPEQRDLLFDYFARAAPAFREATEEIRAASRARSEAPR